MTLYLREWRKTKGFTQQELGEAAGVGFVTLSRAERGEQSPTVETVEKIAHALGIGPGLLFELPPEEHSPKPKRRKRNGKRKR